MSSHPNAPAGEVNVTKKKWEIMVSFWNKISVPVWMIAVSMDPLFFYIAFLDREKVCLGTDKRLRTEVLITRSLADFTFLCHIMYQLWDAAPKPVTTNNSTIFNWFGHAKAIAKNLSWSSFLIDIFAILPIPHMLILAVLYAPNYGFSENKMNLNYIILAQYVPRMYRIFISIRLFRKNSSVWLKAAFYFFMYIISSHVIGAFWHFSCVQIEAVCWHWALKGSVSFQCDDPLLSESDKNIISTLCSTERYDYGSFMETIQTGFTGHRKLREKLFYFLWWGLKNLSNYGTNLNTSDFIWENCFAILVSGIGLVLFALLIGNMQECFQSAEEMKVITDKMKVITDKVELKGRELQDWMNKDRLLESGHTEEWKIEIMTNILKRMKENKDADLENLFSLIPWNSMKSLKRTLCMSMLKKVTEPMPRYFYEEGLGLICDHLKPVTYNEKTIVFRMGEPLDSMLLVLEGTMVIYTTSTTTVSSTPGEITGNPSTEHRSLENESVYGQELLSWAQDTPVTYATLPISTGNVKCLSQVEGFVLSAKDLKTSFRGQQGNLQRNDRT